ncbi:acetyl-CoA C-acetyltransferase [Spartinivicinus ruber]|uniref:acetyl-CoA C-acetyltransferase n=1 Tax=Spartinivicinus ruber TaxID=2683272 RepID=UPI0013D04872|nr:acetyl-CoA C-acetyltransferase [Spartinivicinus ruber]
MTQQAYIFDAIRTPRGKGKPSGALYSVKPVRLVSNLLSTLQQRHNLDTSLVDDVVLGCVTPISDQGANIAKTATSIANWDVSVAGVQINRFCASGLEAVNMAAMKVASGWEQLVVCGGIESMSRVPMGSDGGAWPLDPETNLHTAFVPQGISADLIASLEGFSRTQLDEFAVNSQQKATHAWKQGYFNQSVIPVIDQNGMPLLEKDEHIKSDTTTDVLAGLKPVFAQIGELGFDEVGLNVYSHLEKISHLHTAGNSSGIVDGAAVVLIGSETMANQLGLTPRGRIISTAVTSTDPTLMLTGPTPATEKALTKAGLSIADIDLFEVNEAFAAVVLKFAQDLSVPMEKINVNGGAIAMGHPLGATGAMLLGTLLDELERRQLKYGVVTLCVGGGMGVATVIERLSN